MLNIAKPSNANAVADAISRSQAVIEFQPDGTIITANEKFLNAMGYTLVEIKGKHHRMFVDPDYANSMEYKQFWQKLAAGEYQAAEYKRIGKGGRAVWIQASYNPILGWNGKAFKVVKFATDITEAKIKSLENNGQIEAIGKSQAVIHFNLDGTIIWANENFCTAMGYRLDEIQGRHHRIFAEPAYAASTEYQQFWEKLAAGEYQAAEYKRIGKGGREVWIQASYNPILDESGKPFKIIKFATDITETKLRNAEYEGQVNAIGKSQAVIHFQPDGTILWANENFCTAMGYRLDEIQGKHHSIFAEPAYANSTEYQQFWEKLRRGEFQAAEYKRIGKGGREVYIQASYNPILGPDGKVFKVIKFATDVTATVIRRKENENKSVQMAENVTGLLQSMGQITNEMDTTATEMLGKAQHSENLSSSVANAAVELSASIKEISARLTETNHMSNLVNHQTEQADVSINALNKAIFKISGITEVIEKVAGQTNLLALNATIEASRAGDAGRGFAVVAQEVKNLARQTADSTNDIREQVQSINTVAVQTTDSIRTIIDSVRQITNATTQIAAAVEEQSVITNEVSANIKGVTSASRSTGESAIQVQQVAASLNRNSSALGNEVRQFLSDSRAA